MTFSYFKNKHNVSKIYKLLLTILEFIGGFFRAEHLSPDTPAETVCILLKSMSNSLAKDWWSFLEFLFLTFKHEYFMAFLMIKWIKPFLILYVNYMYFLCNKYAIKCVEATKIFYIFLSLHYLVFGFIYRLIRKHPIITFLFTIVDFAVFINFMVFVYITKYRLFYFHCSFIYLWGFIRPVKIFNRFLDRVHSLTVKYDPATVIVFDFFPFVFIIVGNYFYWHAYYVWFWWDFEFYLHHQRFPKDYIESFKFGARFQKKAKYNYSSIIRKW